MWAETWKKNRKDEEVKNDVERQRWKAEKGLATAVNNMTV
jgi:hypothetical protein